MTISSHQKSSHGFKDENQLSSPTSEHVGMMVTNHLRRGSSSQPCRKVFHSLRRSKLSSSCQNIFQEKESNTTTVNHFKPISKVSASSPRSTSSASASEPRFLPSDTRWPRLALCSAWSLTSGEDHCWIIGGVACSLV